MTVEVSILMPCLNEAETIASCIQKANEWLASSQISGEVVVADNGSTDGSQLLAQSLGARVIQVEKRGYGAALFAGIKESRGKYIIMGDSDDSYNFRDLDAFLIQLRKGFDLVMGNRFANTSGIQKGAMPWKNRYIGNPALSLVGRILFRVKIRDFHCGLRGFSSMAIKKLDLRTTGMEFASEMVIKAQVLSLKITEVPIVLYKDGRSRPPHLNPWRDGRRHLRFMLSLSPVWLFTIPGALLAFCGTLLYIPLLFGPVKIGGLTLSLNALIYSQAAVILGSISLVFGAAIRIFAAREGLLPTTPFIAKTVGRPIFEVGGLVGLMLISLGGLFAYSSIVQWANSKFGPLVGTNVVTSVSASVTLLLLGGLVLLSSLLFGFLSLPLRKNANDTF